MPVLRVDSEAHTLLWPNGVISIPQRFMIGLSVDELALAARARRWVRGARPHSVIFALSAQSQGEYGSCAQQP